MFSQEERMFRKAAVRFGICLLLLVLYAGIFQGTICAQTTQSITVVDDLGREVDIPFPVKRVVAFNRYNSEFFRAVGGIEVLVGLDKGALKHEKYWPGFDPENVVGSSGSTEDPNYEKIVSLQPDVVVFARNSAWEKAAEKLEPFGIPVVVITGWDVEKHIENINLVGQMLGKQERAEELNQFYLDHINLVTERLKDIPKKKIYLEKVPAFHSPLEGSGHHMMLVRAGGENIFGHIKFSEQPQSKGNVHEFEIDPEQILLSDPEVIVKYIKSGSYLPPTQDELKATYEELVNRPGWDALQAVKNKRVYVISFFPAGGCSKMVGVTYVAKWLYPELFEDLDPDAVMREWLEKYQGVPYPGDYYYSPTKE
jgi:iron complex transport system substrate-binding protein